MRVLLTGGSGFIGSAVADALRQRGDEVVPVVRSEPKAGQVLLDVAAGLVDASRLPGGSLDSFGAAVHLAGAPIIGRWTSAKKEAIRSSRIAAGDLLARTLAGLAEPPAVLVSGSAIGYYGDTGETEVDESGPSGAGFLPEVCRAWEASATPANQAGIRTVSIRTGIVLGPGGGALKPQMAAFKLGLGGKLGSGRQWMSVVSLADEVGTILAAIDDPSITGPLNAVCPEPVRNSDFTKELAAIVKRPAIMTVPAAALRLALGSGPADEMLLVSQRVVPGKLEAKGYAFKHRDARSALQWAASGASK